jgi:hypothetical protein
MSDTPLNREQYVHQVLETYQRTPGTSGQVRPPDRQLARELQQRGVPLRTVENAFVLAAARRIFRPAEAPPLTTVRSLAYFVPVIEELLATSIDENYFEYLRRKLEPFYSHNPHLNPNQSPRQTRRG